VAAVVRRGEALLITRRLDGAAGPGLWEFPGGKVEPGEGEPDALRREVGEELGCEIEVGPLLLRHSHTYPDLEVELAFYAARLAPGATPRSIQVAEMAWAAPGTLPGYPFLEADRAVLPDIESVSARVGDW